MTQIEILGSGRNLSDGYKVEASRDNAERLPLALSGANAPVAPTQWNFGQLAGLIGAPAAYLRQLPAPLTGINLHMTKKSQSAVLSAASVPTTATCPRDFISSASISSSRA